jgi:probable addiction module antidote protein
MAERFYEFDPAEMLDSVEAIEAFLAEAMATNDARFFASAVAIVARAKTLTKTAPVADGNIGSEEHR